MLSRTADHLFWMSRYTERAVLSAPADRVRSTTTPPRAPARRGSRPYWN
ncbi:MAG: alpha-E domain-containing protein [Ottowia sp.]|uniref:Alpha-E domain-containing protein n=1 Tax=Ottowia beijingensis TaxID=1207057 RepID=A0A853IYY0_9BURK|nr:alpha-E domain-containing protein [Ottowia beijingensis]MBP6778953.1 alpha-E domain-containing protein [Ottowia sp.]MBP7531164.1 alpha-E domain-containing protein [Ottowia sp.]MBP7535674.1 alpha-E domain-containing protein [Ottowia sp.]MBP9953594.1 alpha-E domain-containing protein [Ottowia sp.]NZA03130.1 alpha-E domain-containing protein [Ottowia beijingensis]